MTQGKIFTKGLHTCGSVWFCAWCTAKNRFERHSQIESILNAFQENVGGQILMQTLTLSHGPNVSLANLLKCFKQAWKVYNRGEVATKEKVTYGQFGYLRALEIRHSAKTGWNVHIHILRLLNGYLDSKGISDWHDNCVNRWTNALTSVGLRKPSPKGQDMRQLEQTQGLAKRMAEYLTKQIAVPYFKSKTKSTESRSPWEILENYADAPNSNDALLWQEFELATKGCRQLQTSSNLRKKLGVIDPYLAVNSAVEFIDIKFADSGNSALVKNPLLRGEAHAAFKQGGLDAICVWLEERGVDYELKTGTTNEFSEDELVVDWVDV